MFRRAPAYQHGDRLILAGSPVRLRVSAKARRISLRIDSRAREVIATAPTPRRLVDAVNFATERAQWMAGRLAALPAGMDLSELTTLHIFGEPYVLERQGLRAKLDEPTRTLTLPADPARVPGALTRLLKRHGLAVMTARTQIYCDRLGKPVPRVSLTDARTRWGSCQPGGPRQSPAIRYSWRLALAPFAVADYVAAHECAHLVEANHSPRFWAVVTGLCGDPKPHRAWLKTHGPGLHAILATP